MRKKSTKQGSETTLYQRPPLDQGAIPYIAEDLRPLAIPVWDIVLDPNNANEHNEDSIAVIKGSLAKFGQRKAVVVNAHGCVLEAGEGTVTAARLLGWTHVAAVLIADDNLTHAAFGLADNKTSEYSKRDETKVARLLAAIQADDPDTANATGYSPEAIDAMKAARGGDGSGESEDFAQNGDAVMPAATRTLAERFGVPPFSILDSRMGYWQERKKAWIALGLMGEVGRGTGAKGDMAGATYSISAQSPTAYNAKNKYETSIGRKVSWEEFAEANPDVKLQTGTSVFDPVLCELAFRWFCPPGGRVLDPFAGEATKGVVASYLGYDYTGIELRADQVEINRAMAQNVAQTAHRVLDPQWINGDSAQLEHLIPEGQMFDFIWTSPPYYDLEIYSQSEKDGSAFETYEKFMAWYRDIFRQAVAHLRDNRFLGVKIGEVRDKRSGAYRNFVGDNIACFRDLGLRYYNEAILVQPTGGVAMRAGKQFSTTRKLGRTHQNILFFYKGDLKQIREEFGFECEFAELSGGAEDADVEISEQGDSGEGDR